MKLKTTLIASVAGKAAYVLILFCLSGLFLQGCMQSPPVPVSKTGFYFDTVITVTLYDPASEALLEGCMEIAQTYENLISRTKEGSDIRTINESGGEPVAAQEETLLLLNAALSIAEQSEGLLDPTIGSLSSLWNFGRDNQKIVPSKEQIEEALSHVNYQNVVLSGNQVSLSDPLAKLDLGFLAKGYIADRMKEYLTANGVTSGLINLGGNILAIGNKPDNSAFHIGIQEPFAPSGTALFSLSVTDCAAVSSGSYERCFEKDGRLYHHILSTQNGYPVANDLSQVTILCESAAKADALSTLCFILGYEQGKALIDSLADTEAVFVTTAGEVRKTF